MVGLCDANSFRLKVGRELIGMDAPVFHSSKFDKMMRQKKDKFKRQEHRKFIERFIAVPAKITRSGHQIEIKMYENHFYKADWKELDRLVEAA